MKKYSKLTPQEVSEHEKHLIEKADRFWVEMYGRKDASDVDKLRLLSRQGRIQDTFQHEIMTHYFKKQGLWRDGRTTLEERKVQLVEEKAQFGKKIAQLRDTKIRDINNIIMKAQEEKEKLKQIPVTLYKKYQIDKKQILDSLTTDLDTLFTNAEKEISKEITTIYDNFIAKTQKLQEQLITQAHQDLLDLQSISKREMQRKVESFSAELEAELSVREYGGNEEELIEKYTEEIKMINQELNELEKPLKLEIDSSTADLDYELYDDSTSEVKEEEEEIKEEIIGESQGLADYTVKELKQIADANNIKYDPRIRKADLIELLKV